MVLVGVLYIHPSPRTLRQKKKTEKPLPLLPGSDIYQESVAEVDYTII